MVSGLSFLDGAVKISGKDELMGFLSQIFNAAKIGIEITDETGKFIWVNSAFTRITGYGREEVIGKPGSILKSGKHGKTFYENMWQTILSGNAWQGEILNKHKNGNYYFVEETIVPIIGENGEITRFVGIKQDISAWKKTEEALNESYIKYEELAYIVNESPAIGFLWKADEGMPVEFVSDNVRQFGYTPDDFYSGRISFLNIIHPKDRNRIIEELYHRALIGEEKFKQTFRILNTQNKVRWVENYISVRHGTHGVITNFQGVILDITSRRKAEKEAKLKFDRLIQADKMVALGTLVAGVAHEINNPNNFVMLNINLIEKTWYNILPILDDYYRKNGDFYVGNRLKYSKIKESMPKILNGISEGTKRIKNIVNELKEFSGKESSDVNQNVDVNKVIEAAINLTKNLINKSTENFSVKFAPDLPTVRGNRQRLEQVVINLIENACQALQDNSKRIYVVTKYLKEENSVQIMIVDEGEGIAPGVLKKIKDPFFTTKREKGGTGLGLAVSNRIIEAHKGRLTFESEFGKGTKAIIKLPAVEKKEMN